MARSALAMCTEGMRGAPVNSSPLYQREVCVSCSAAYEARVPGSNQCFANNECGRRQEVLCINVFATRLGPHSAFENKTGFTVCWSRLSGHFRIVCTTKQFPS